MEMPASLRNLGAQLHSEHFPSLHFLLYICATQLEAKMAASHTRGEMHGCIVCGKLYDLYVVYDAAGHFLDSKVMTSGGHSIAGKSRPLVACDKHSEDEVSRAVHRVFGERAPEEDS